MEAAVRVNLQDVVIKDVNRRRDRILQFNTLRRRNDAIIVEETIEIEITDVMIEDEEITDVMIEEDMMIDEVIIEEVKDLEVVETVEKAIDVLEIRSIVEVHVIWLEFTVRRTIV